MTSMWNRSAPPLGASDRVCHVRMVGVGNAHRHPGAPLAITNPPPTRRGGNHALGTCLIAALAAEGVGALVDETCPAAVRRRPAGLPCPLGCSWPQAAPIS